MYFYTYTFHIERTVDGQKVLQEVYFYASHEKEARRQFEEHYGYPAGELVRRDQS